MNRDRSLLLWRIAASVRRQAEGACAAREPPDLPLAAWEECLRLEQLLQTAQRRGWPAAERLVRARLLRAAADCRRQLTEAEETLGDSPARPATIQEVYEDLVALEDEYGQVKFDAKAKELTVRTEVIVLDGMDLGQFEIALDWSKLAAHSGAYSIEAVDPRPASVDSELVHPHVKDGSLCEGDARPALMAALKSGRLGDFFTIVERTLSTYNPHSAFLALHRWHGTPCDDCGSLADEDERSLCERCECDLCDSCAQACQDCGHTACCACMKSCDGCSAQCCVECITTCRQCRRRFCEGCHTDEVCNDCREATEDEDDGQARTVVPVSAAPAPADAVRLGQAPLPA